MRRKFSLNSISCLNLFGLFIIWIWYVCGYCICLITVLYIILVSEQKTKQKVWAKNLQIHAEKMFKC